MLKRRRARQKLIDFTVYTKPDYEVNWHHRVLCSYLDRFVAGDIKRLMVSCPPRHGKSELVSRRLPAYILGRNPDASIIACSYGDALASRMNRDVQRIMDDPQYLCLFPKSRLYASNVRTVSQGTYLRNSDLFEIVEYRGVYRSAGVGSGITGLGANYALVDDPCKNREEANSPVSREKLWEWYTSTFYTRLEKNGSILVTLTRWHEDDLAGRLLQLAKDDPRADQWTVVSFPAVAEEKDKAADDPRQEGEPLWENKYDSAALASIKATIGSYDWESLYQQRPRPPGGSVFKREWFRIVERAPEELSWVRYWDLAASQKQSADFCASVAVAMATDGTVYLRDMVHGKWEWPDQEKIITQTILAEPHTRHGIEKALHGIAALQSLMRKPELAGRSIQGIDVHQDKLIRALPLVSRAEIGKVVLVRGEWVPKFLDEICAFSGDGSTHDDMTDSASGGLLMLNPGKSRKLVTF